MRRLADAILRHPWVVVGMLAGAQLALMLVVASSAPHDGWVYAHDPQVTSHSTLGWLLGGLDLGPAEVGYGWPFVLMPVTWVTGATFVQALPAVLVLNALLAPLGLACIYALGARLAGVVTGLLAATAWVLVPFAAVPLWEKEVGERWQDETLPQLVGLTALPDLPATVVLLVAALLVVRSLEPRHGFDAVAAGVLTGFAAAMRPACLLLVVGAVPAFLLARRLGATLAFLVALLPAVIAFAVWKERGLGDFPLDPGDPSVEHWKLQMRNLGEFFWSARLAQWIPLAGVIALAMRRAWPGLALLVGWLGATLALVGASQPASIEGGTFFAAVLPAWPAYVLLLATVPLLVPTLVRRLDWRVRPVPASGSGLGRAPVAFAFALLALLPLGLVVVAEPLDGPQRAVVRGEGLLPVDADIDLRVAADAGANRLTWTARSWRAGVLYRVYRSAAGEPDVACVDKGAARCTLRMTELGTTRETQFVDPSPLAGDTYRVGVATAAIERGPELFAISAPARAP